MAKVSGPYFSCAASGQVGEAFQVRGNRYGHHCYRPRPRNQQNQGPASPRQAAQRSIYAAALAAWRSLEEDARNEWNSRALCHTQQVSGWAIFFQSRARPAGLIDGGTAGYGGSGEQAIDGGSASTVFTAQLSGGSAFEAFMAQPELLDGGTAGDSGDGQAPLDGGSSDSNFLNDITGGSA